MQDFEKLGVFYLGRRFDPARRQVLDELMLYDSKDLTTHAVCVGMTGSGKTGLCLALLEEAAIDGIPAIAIDPKGDLGNLLLDVPRAAAGRLSALGRSERRRAARPEPLEQYSAGKTAKQWREGLAEWGQEPERIAPLSRRGRHGDLHAGQHRPACR